MHDVQVDIRILAWRLMTNHFHVVAVPGAEDSQAVLLCCGHGRYEQKLAAGLKRT